MTASSRWWTVALLFGAILVNYLDRGALSVATVPIMREFSITPAAMGMLLSAFFWAYTLLQIPAGWLVDRYGLKWTYTAGFLLWSLASAAVGLAGSVGQVFALRLLLGIGESVAAPASLAYIRGAFHRDEQGLPTAVYLSGMMLGPALGALLGGLLLERVGWRLLFLLTGLGGGAWLLPWLLAAPARPHISEGRQGGPEPVRAAWGAVLRSGAFWGITIGSFCYSYAWYFYLSWLPGYFVLQHRLSYSDMGVATGLPLLGTAVMGLLAGRAADRVVRRMGRPIAVRRNFVCAGLGGAGVALLWLRGAGTAAAATLVLVVALAGIGIASANFWALTQALAPSAIAGRVFGYQNTVGNLAGIFAPILTGILVGRERSFGTAILVAALALMMAAAFLSLVRERHVSLLELARRPDTAPSQPR